MKLARLSTASATGVIGAALLAALLPATAQAVPVAAAAPSPHSSSILVSEIANGGAGATSNADRVGADDFIEIGNFGAEPVDISGYRILRCGQTGDAYGPQKVVPDGTTLAPGDTYTIGSANSTNKDVVKRDADYDATGSTLHSFGFGAYIETPDYTVLDSVGFYHPSVHSDCQRPTPVSRPLDHRLSQSHQRVANTGDPAKDWIVAGRTPDAPNATAAVDNLAPSTVKISEVANGNQTSTASQYVELANYGTEPIDVSGWKFYRCGENGTSYLQHAGLPSGTTIPAGETFVYAHASAGLSDVTVGATYSSGMHWRDFGVLITRADDKIVDGVGFYANRNSICTQGSPQSADLNSMQAESYHRVSDTGDNAEDFLLARERTPGAISAKADLSKPADFVRGDLRFSEIVGAGPAGGNDEFVEIANYGKADINLAGYSLSRCEGDGRGNAGYQVPDLGDVTLRPGEVYVAAAAGAPADLRAAADATYTTGLNQTDGYGMYLRDPQGAMVDAVGAYETVTYSPCVIGSELRNYTKNDQGESYQRARTTDDNEEDFVKTPDRTPGVLADVEWVDPTKPLPGETDAVDVATEHVPGTPKAEASARAEGFKATVKTDDEDGGDLAVTLHAAEPVGVDGTKIYAGSTKRKKPATRTITGERRVTTAESLETKAGQDTYPFQRFAIPVETVPAGGVEFTWSGSTRDRNEIQMYGWNGEEWSLLTERSPSADGDLTLVGALPADSVIDNVANILVIDGPRVSGGAVDAIGVTDQSFLKPEDYDFAFNHMSDTQFLAEGFRGVFRQMATWVVANADARKIAYSTNTGDIIENWIGGNADEVRARKEFAAARAIHEILNDADVPNGVLPGNHDNFWGRNNDLYNEYFGPELYEDESWWGGSWKAGDNSAHYDFFEKNGVDFLALSLPYRPSQAQIEWAAEVADSYPNHNVILLTHSYLTTEKEIENRDNRYTARGEELWRDLIAPSDNIFLVLGGHYHGVATKYGDPVTGEQSDAIEIAEDTVAVRNVGETGRTVVQMLADYQGYRSSQPTPRDDTLDRDSGFQRLLQFDIDAELMAVNSYSPYLDSFEAYKYDEPGKRGTPAGDYQDGRYLAKDDEFVAKVDLLVEKKLATESWGLISPSSKIDTKTAAAGAEASFDLPALPEGSLWFASVEDATGHTVATRPELVTIGTDPVEPPNPDAAATTTEAWGSSNSQVYGATAGRRVVVGASVTSAAPDGTKARGAVQFRTGQTVLGQVALSSNGVARLRLPARLPVGNHRITATFVPSDPAAQAPSSATAAAVRVVKASTTARSRLAKKSIRAKSRAKVTVTVRAAGLPVSGRVSVKVTRKGKSRTVTGTVRNGKVTVRLPRLRKGTYTVSSRYRGSSMLSSATAPRVALRVR